MNDNLPSTPFAFVSFGSGVVACLVAVAMPAIYTHGMRQEATGVSAALAVLIFAAVVGTLGCVGVGTGIVALRGIRAGRCGGRGWAWTGIGLGCVPFVVLAGYLVPSLW